MELVINSYGTSLMRDNERFAITHPDGKQYISPEGIKSIVISKGAAISSDAAMLAIENNIDVIFLDSSGNPLGRIWSVKYGSISNIRRKQLDFTFSYHAVDWIKSVLIKKMDNQIALLYAVVDNEKAESLNLNAFINRISDYKTKIESKAGFIVSDVAPSLRGWEGAASRIYFSLLSQILPEEYKFTERSQHPAMDYVNCILNYGYGILYGKIEGALIKAGIDPYVGVMHRDDYNRPVLVFDIIEMYRIWIDFVVVHLCKQLAFTEECFSQKNDGSMWLEPLGRRILIQSVNDYLSEVIMHNGLERSRLTHIELFASNFAQYLLNLKI